MDLSKYHTSQTEHIFDAKTALSCEADLTANYHTSFFPLLLPSTTNKTQSWA